MPREIAGKLLSGTVDGITISGLYSYSFREKVDRLDGTTGADAGFEHPVAGVQGGVLTCRAYFDLSEAPFTPFPIGAEVLNIVIADDPDVTPWLDMPTGLVTEREKTGEVKGRLEYTLTIETVGEYTYTGN